MNIIKSICCIVILAGCYSCSQYTFEEDISGGWYYFDLEGDYNELYFQGDSIAINTEIIGELHERRFKFKNNEVSIEDFSSNKEFVFLFQIITDYGDSLETTFKEGKVILYRLCLFYNPFKNSFSSTELDALFMNRMENAKIVKGILEIDSDSSKDAISEIVIDIDEE